MNQNQGNMDYPAIRKQLDEFWPRMVIKIDKLPGYKGKIVPDVSAQYDEVLNICRKALRKEYSIVVNENKHTIEIGKAIKDE
jgi:hypothetical protein